MFLQVSMTLILALGSAMIIFCCSQGWVGHSCLSICPGGEENPCSSHGTCYYDKAYNAACHCEIAKTQNSTIIGYHGDDCSLPIRNINATKNANALLSNDIYSKPQPLVAIIPPATLLFVVIVFVISKRILDARARKLAEVEHFNRQVSRLSKLD